MATHSSVLAWRIPGTGEPGGLPSMGWHRVRHDWSDLAAAATFICKQSNDISIIFKINILTKRKCFNSSHWRPSWLQTILQSYSHQNSMVLAQRQKYRWRKQNRKPRDEPTCLGHLIFDKGGKNIQWSIDNLFKKRCWEKWSTTGKRMKLEHCLTPYTK